MSQQSQKNENKCSNLLTREENEQVFALLGNRCLSLATTVVQLFLTQPPHHLHWIKRDTGVLCFIKDNMRKNFFFRLYCLRRNNVLWEQEMYDNMEYISTCPFFHTFEGEDCIIAFNFANNLEAEELKAIVESKIQAKRKRNEKQRMKNNLQDNYDQPRLPTNNDLMFYKKHSDAEDRKAKRRRNITKADIGNPSEFRHVSHVGWDPDKGFDITGNDPHLTNFLRKAGVSQKDLKSKSTREFIYGFIDEHRDEIQEIQSSPSVPAAGPPVPPRGAPRTPHSRAAPPPPPPPSFAQQQAPKPPPPPVKVNSSQDVQFPVAPSVMAPVPPPPPPPLAVVASPVPPPMPSSIPAPPVQVDPRAAMLESIREGTTLKPVELRKEVLEEEAPRDARGDLMSEIRKGFQLKPVSEREVKSSVAEEKTPSSDLAAVLARALAERNRVIHSEDESTSDTDSNDDDWDA